MTRKLILLGLLAGAGSMAAAAAQPGSEWRPRPGHRSVLSVGQGRAMPGGQVVLQVLLEDRRGTPLGRDAAAEAAIQGIALKVRCVPASAVTEVIVRRAGATAGLRPLFESQKPRTASTASYLASFSEATDPIPLDELSVVAEVVVKLARTAAPGTLVDVRLDPQVTALSNQAGTVLESVPNGWLMLWDGRILVGPRR